MTGSSPAYLRQDFGDSPHRNPKLLQASGEASVGSFSQIQMDGAKKCLGIFFSRAPGIL